MDFSKYNLPQKKQGMQPTFLHDVVRQTCEYLYGCNANDPACWKMWLGIGKNFGAAELKNLLTRLKEKYNATGEPKYKSAKYFIACTRRPIS